MTDDELAVTATATPESRETKAVGFAPGSKLGRYVIDRVLGMGGMGVVYAAFDPELERRVALKVLRAGLAGDAGERLLREARAMARLADPNVVAVYEVGHADERDYIAMELIDGEPLVDWLRAEKRDARAVLAAYVAAGRGLATAHDASIVHRDFKPHNVLRSKRGRIVVTDFGLAREATPDADALTPAAGLAAYSALSGLTQTGSMLGTPAYMAPEQWTGGDVTPATDQFAFCVALWEGLTGDRPYGGETLDELRAKILAGPTGLDASRLPRRVRRALLRGLAVDPAARWPSMTALLGHLEHRSRAPAIGVAVIAAAAIAIGVGAVTLGSHAPSGAPPVVISACDPPAIPVSAVWGPAEQQAIRAGSGEAADRLGSAFDAWQRVRDDVCQQPAAARSKGLACLDKVLLRLDAIRRGRLFDPEGSLWAVFAQPFAPEVCLRVDPPRMPEQYSDAAIVFLAKRGGILAPPDVMAKARADVEHDACARAYMNFTEQAPDAPEQAKRAAQLCGDDQAYAAASMNVVSKHSAIFPDPGVDASIVEAERAADHAGQPFLSEQFLLFRANVGLIDGDLEKSLRYLDRAAGGDSIDLERERRLLRVGILLDLDRPGDRAEVLRDAAWLRAHDPDPGTAVMIDAIEATVRWYGGDVEHSHHDLIVANARLAPAEDPSDGPVAGVVVDAHGAPVAGARVAVGEGLLGDSAGIAVALYGYDAFPQPIQRAITAADGRFAFAHVSSRATIVAERGTELRSRTVRVAAAARLVLAPTVTIHGTVPASAERGVLSVAAGLPGEDDETVAPVGRDGSFSIGGLPTGTVRLRTTRTEFRWTGVGTPLVVHTGGSDAIVVPPPSLRRLVVIVRSASGAPIDGGSVVALAGAVRVETVGESNDHARSVANATDVARALPALLPADLASLYRHGDVVSILRGVPDGAVTVCARGYQVDASDPGFWSKYAVHEEAQPVRCAAVAADAKSVVIEVPPMNRID